MSKNPEEPLPRHVQRAIPADLIRRWSDLPPETPLTFQLTRGDMDRLMLGLRQTGSAVSLLALCMVDLSAGNQKEATDIYRQHVEAINDAHENINRFIEIVMTKATLDE